jgi:hypothetical protein
MGMSLKLQKRLAASVLNCGKRKIWMDPSESNEISLANSRTCTPTGCVPRRRRGCSAGVSRGLALLLLRSAPAAWGALLPPGD